MKNENLGLTLKYFVLNPTSSDPAFRKASRDALRAFASTIMDSNEALADDLYTWLEDLTENKN